MYVVGAGRCIVELIKPDPRTKSESRQWAFSGVCVCVRVALYIYVGYVVGDSILD